MTTTFVFAWSRHLAENGNFRLVDAKDEKDARQQVRESTNVRSTRNCFLMPAEEFKTDLERLVALNREGKGVVRLVGQRSEVLERLSAELER